MTLVVAGKQPRRVFSPDVKFTAMKALLAGEPVQDLALRTGISIRTLTGWKAQAKAAAVPYNAAEMAKKDVLELLQEGRLTTLRHAIDPEIVALESAYYASMAFRNLNEAYQLLTGGPTHRIDLATFLSSRDEPETA